MPGGSTPTDRSEADDGETDIAVSRAAADAALELIDERLDRSAVDDVDVTVRFADGTLDLDVRIDAPDADRADPQQVADDAVRAAEAAADRVLREQEDHGAE